MLKEGDILAFKAGDHWLSQCIAMLTNSDVSHAAMVCHDGKLVEMELPGIQMTPFTAQEGSTAYLMRLDPELDPLPLVEAAEAYMNAKTRYDIPGLVILGSLLIYQSIRPTPEFVIIADLILRKAALMLDQFIHSLILHNPEKTMVCSQLVYQIYNDCDDDYHIHLEHGIFQVTGEDKSIAQDGAIRLIELIQKEIAGDTPPPVDSQNEFFESIPHDTQFYAYDDADTEELARRLCETMRSQENGSGAAESGPDAVKPLLVSARRLLALLEKCLKKCHYDIPIDAFFVTPADFVYHSKNLRLIKTLDIIKG